MNILNINVLTLMGCLMAKMVHSMTTDVLAADQYTITSTQEVTENSSEGLQSTYPTTSSETSADSILGNATTQLDSSTISLLPTCFIDKHRTMMFKKTLAYGGICVFPIGLLFNTLSLSVFFSKKQRSHSHSKYLSVLAISDTFYLFVYSANFIGLVVFGQLLEDYDDVLCKIQNFCAQYFKSLSMFMVLVFTFERLIATVYPLRHSSWCTPKRSSKLIAACVILAFLVNGSDLYTYRIDQVSTSGNKCFYPESLDKFVFYHYSVTFVIQYVCGNVMLFVLNIIIIVTLAKGLKWRKSLQSDKKHVQPLAQKQRKLTVTLVSVSIVSTLLQLPYVFTKILIFFPFNFSDDICQSKQIKSELFNAYRVCLLVLQLNYAVNFILYSLTGTEFRKQLKNNICGNQQEMSLQNVVTGTTEMTNGAGSSRCT